MSDPNPGIRTPVSLDYTHTADPATAMYLDGLTEQRLIGGRCPSCHRVLIPIKSICATCTTGPLVPLDLPPTGHVSTFCIIGIPFNGQALTPPYACAHIMLDGADVPLFHLISDCSPQDVHSGLRVEAVWNDAPEATGHARLMFFRPAKDPR
jgi:uncharacterized OB-fold protein